MIHETLDRLPVQQSDVVVVKDIAVLISRILLIPRMTRILLSYGAGHIPAGRIKKLDAGCHRLGTKLLSSWQLGSHGSQGQNPD